jgi:hypothetical protein
MFEDWVGILNRDEFMADYARGVLGGGVPGAVHAADAALEGDWDRFRYNIAVEGSVLGTYWGILQIMNYIQGPKYAMSFLRAHSSIGAARGLVGKAFLANPLVSVPLVTAAVSYGVHSGHQAVAESLPEHEQPGFWQMVGAALGGNVGVGDHGLF